MAKVSYTWTSYTGLKGRVHRLICGVSSFYTRGVVVFVVLALVGCGANNQSQDGHKVGGPTGTMAPFPVTTSGLAFGTSSGLEKVFWLDNDHALLPAYAVEHHKGPDGKDVLSAPPLGIYIWDVKQNTYTRYADLVPYPRLFQYDHGNIAYMIENTDPLHGVISVMVGKMGEEKRITIEGAGIHPELEPSKGPNMTLRKEPIGDDTKIMNAYALLQRNGHWPASWGEPKTKNVHFYALLPQHGYIYLSTTTAVGDPVDSTNQNDHVKLYRPGGAQPIELPILVKEMGTSAYLIYSDYLGKYVLFPHMPASHDLRPYEIGQGWADNEPFTVYFISPDGAVETQKIPPGFWQPAGPVYPTRQGLFWASNDTRGHAGGGVLLNKNAGGWLLHDGKMIKLFDHYADGAGVSPDGCTIVYANNDHNPKKTKYVQAIHLCADLKQ